MKKILAATFLSALLFAPQAEASDPLIEGAKLCTRHLPRYEREYGIPTHLLSAIASTESGRYHEGLKIRIPWPWTINADGKSYYLNTKAEAIATAKKLKARGIRSMDIGCMQVNILHHSNAFASLEAGFEPANNVAYAASFLRSLYQESNSWKQASAAYHSKTPVRGSEYVGRVYNSWYQIIDKLRLAKLQVPESSVVAMNALKKKETKVAQAPAAKSIRPLPEQVGKQVASYRAPRMNSIQVSSRKAGERENGVLVIRPKITVVDTPGVQPASLTVAQAKKPATASDIPESKQASVGKNGPAFIFSD